MQKIDRIRGVALLSKVVLDCIPLDETERNDAKGYIDFGAALLKFFSNTCTEQRALLVASAQRHNIERVTVFPYEFQEKHMILVRAYGAETGAFFREMGVQTISENAELIDPIFLAQMESKYGRVLYDSRTAK